MREGSSSGSVAAMPASAAGIIKHSVTIAGHATSISLESAFWEALKEMALERHLSVAALIAEIDALRIENALSRKNLSSAIRVYILEALRDIANRAPRAD
ncbi:ribbon-helix-helix domain-containing protein [Beijerinckia mobilis]|uniref:ribbon-helix-helix domain-containing protein n=1 Tax=Beijerinckia mobilis TaxID=231434 RepID=UPI001FD993A2|nr:ribbon-helix-helix domain-containing protein [Beijerinckia mobilis]